MDKPIAALLMQTIGLIDQENWDAAEIHLSEASSHSGAVNSPFIQAQLYALRAMIEEGRNAHEPARSSWIDAVDSIQVQGDDQNLAATLLAFGWSEFEFGFRCESLLLFELAVATAERSGSGPIARGALSAVASALVSLGQYESAAHRLTSLILTLDQSAINEGPPSTGPSIQEAIKTLELEAILRSWHESRLSKEYDQIGKLDGGKRLDYIAMAQKSMRKSFAFDPAGEECVEKVLTELRRIDATRTSIDGTLLRNSLAALASSNNSPFQVEITQSKLSALIQVATSKDEPHASTTPDPSPDGSAPQISAVLDICIALIGQGRIEDAKSLIQSDVLEVLTPSFVANLPSPLLLEITNLLAELDIEGPADIYDYDPEGSEGSPATPEDPESWFLRADKQRALDDLKGARASLREALRCSKRNSDSRSEAVALARLAYIDNLDGRSKQAESKLKTAYNLLSPSGDATMLGSICNQLALLEAESGRVFRAWETGLEALALAYSSGNHMIIAERWRDIGSYSQQVGHMTRAITEVNSALGLYHLIGQLQQESVCFFQIGSVHRDMGEMDEALFYMSISCWLDTTYRLKYEIEHVVHALELAEQHGGLRTWASLLRSASDRKKDYLEQLLSETVEPAD